MVCGHFEPRTGMGLRPPLSAMAGLSAANGNALDRPGHGNHGRPWKRPMEARMEAPMGAPTVKGRVIGHPDADREQGKQPDGEGQDRGARRERSSNSESQPNRGWVSNIEGRLLRTCPPARPSWRTVLPVRS